jgi:hypothetical protein
MLENLKRCGYEQNWHILQIYKSFSCARRHPYVEATVEKGASYFNKNGGKAYLSHYMVEYVMDIRLWKEHTGTEAYKQDILQLIGTEPLPYEIVRYITEFINFTQPNAVTKNEVYNASIKMRQIHKILYDPKNMKKWWINLLPCQEMLCGKSKRGLLMC